MTLEVRVVIEKEGEFNRVRKWKFENSEENCAKTIRDVEEYLERAL